jgi:hypothetical protein
MKTPSPCSKKTAAAAGGRGRDDDDDGDGARNSVAPAGICTSQDSPILESTETEGDSHDSSPSLPETSALSQQQQQQRDERTLTGRSISQTNSISSTPSPEIKLHVHSSGIFSSHKHIVQFRDDTNIFPKDACSVGRSGSMVSGEANTSTNTSSGSSSTTGGLANNGRTNTV